MNQRRWLIAALLLALAPAARAADHQDGAAVKTDPTTDITDVYAWVASDGSVNLVMDVFPFATTTSKFSTDALYVFHTRSAASATATSTPQDVICEFDANQKISCWAGDSFVTGDASATAGITSSDGKMKVFAGLRDDPFFFNLTGFKLTTAAVAQAKSSLTLNAAGCPAIDAATSTALVNQLKTGAGGAAATDDFAGKNVLAIVVHLDKSIVTGGGPLLAVYGATHHK